MLTLNCNLHSVSMTHYMCSFKGYNRFQQHMLLIHTLLLSEIPTLSGFCHGRAQKKKKSTNDKHPSKIKSNKAGVSREVSSHTHTHTGKQN